MVTDFPPKKVNTVLTFFKTYRIYYTYLLHIHRKGALHEIFLAKNISFDFRLCDSL